MLDVPLNALGLAQARVVGDELARTIGRQRDLQRSRAHAETAKPQSRRPASILASMPASASGTLAYCRVVTYAVWRAVDAEGMARYHAGDRTTAPKGGRRHEASSSLRQRHHRHGDCLRREDA